MKMCKYLLGATRKMYAKQTMIYAVINVDSQFYLEQFCLDKRNWFRLMYGWVMLANSEGEW